MKTETTREKPLSHAAKALLTVAAGLTIFVFYLWALVSILLMFGFLAVDAALALIFLRFGLVGLALDLLRRHSSIVMIFLRSLPLRKGVEFRIALKPEDAPELMNVLKGLCARLQLTPPDNIFLEMHLNASVRLKGHRQGTGTTFLSVGYDLLAGLTAREVESVLAHEMAHAKLIQRGISYWLMTGLHRIFTVTTSLNAEVEAYRRAKRKPIVARMFLMVADRFARLSAWLVRTYSRQEEFAADRCAAELCGSAVVRSALSKSDALGARVARIPWRERVAQLQTGSGFSQWLVNELTISDAPRQDKDGPEFFDKYSSHPMLRDRLAALPPDVTPRRGATDDKPGIALLADPDALAEKLMTEIQRTLAQQEDKDSRALRRWQKKVIGSPKLQPLQNLSVLVFIIGAIATLVVGGKCGLFFGALVLVATIAGGIILYRIGRYRERTELPVPDYAALKLWGWKETEAAETGDIQKRMEDELRSRIAHEKKRSKKAAILSAESYAALGKCDYLRAHVAARLCLEVLPNSVEGAMAMAIASGAFRQNDQMYRALSFVNRTIGIRGPSMTWGAAWALYLIGNWNEAEAFLDQAHAQRPDEPNFLILLAIARARRGKMQSAIVSARRACTPQPRNKEHIKVLIDLLLEGGYLREAKERLAALETEVPADAELMLAVARMNLMQHDFRSADEWAERVKQSPAAGPHALVQLGEAYESARRDDHAVAFFSSALEAAFYPEALLGMARIAAARREKELAHKHLLAALNTKKAVGDKGVGPLPLFHQIVAQLRDLQEPQLHCKTWIASFGGDSRLKALANLSFLICAKSRSDAEEHLAMISRSIDPELSSLPPGDVSWRDAPGEQQPDGPARPGIHGVLA